MIVEVKEELVGVSSTSWVLRSNSGYQSWPQAPSPTEPACQPSSPGNKSLSGSLTDRTKLIMFVSPQKTKIIRKSSFPHQALTECKKLQATDVNSLQKTIYYLMQAIMTSKVVKRDFSH